MRSTMFALAAGVLLSLSTAAIAGDTDVTAQPVSAADPHAVVCRPMVHEGVVLRKRICRTRAEWTHQREEDERSFATYQLQSYVLPIRR
jgi:hypothetical protein